MLKKYADQNMLKKNFPHTFSTADYLALKMLKINCIKKNQFGRKMYILNIGVCIPKLKIA